MKENDREYLCGCEEKPSMASQKPLPTDSLLTELSDFFKIFADETRLSILFALEGERMCVCELAAMLGMTKSAISHQLKTLRTSRLVKAEKSGKNVFYSLSDDHIGAIIDTALDHIKE